MLGEGGMQGEESGELGLGRGRLGDDKMHQPVMGTDPKAPVPTGEQQALPLRTPVRHAH